MVKGCCALSFPAEASLECGVLGEVRAQNLDGNAPTQTQITTLMNLSHATTTDYFTDLIAVTEHAGFVAFFAPVTHISS
jgi:hypothetical protein